MLCWHNLNLSFYIRIPEEPREHTMSPNRISTNAFLAFVFLCTSGFAWSQQPLKADRGLLDARNWNFQQQKLPLNGEWYFIANQLVPPDAISNTPGGYLNFPSVWNDLTQPVQYATYRLRVLPPKAPQALALHVPQLYSSYTIWVNDKQVGANGVPGTSRETTIPQWRPQVIPIGYVPDTLTIVMQLANFHHHTGGAREPIYLGLQTALESQHHTALISSLLESIVLAVIGLVSLILLYLPRDKKKIIVYFGLLCFSWALRAAFSNLYVFIQYVPDFDWNIMVRIEYITLFFTMIWGILFLSRLFANEENKIIKYLLVTGNCFFIAYTLIAAPVSFTRWLPVYLLFCAAMLLYSAVVVVRALINERAGVWYLVFSLLITIGIFALDVTAFQGIITYKPVLFSIAYITLFLMLTVALLYHLNIFRSKNVSNMLTFDDMYKNN